MTASAELGDLVDAARAWLTADDERWHAMLYPPYGNSKGAEYWELVREVHTTFQRYADLLQARGLQPPDRRAFAMEMGARWVNL